VWKRRKGVVQVCPKEGRWTGLGEVAGQMRKRWLWMVVDGGGFPISMVANEVARQRAFVTVCRSPHNRSSWELHHSAPIDLRRQPSLVLSLPFFCTMVVLPTIQPHLSTMSVPGISLRRLPQRVTLPQTR